MINWLKKLRKCWWRLWKPFPKRKSPIVWVRERAGYLEICSPHGYINSVALKKSFICKTTKDWRELLMNLTRIEFEVRVWKESEPEPKTRQVFLCPNCNRELMSRSDGLRMCGSCGGRLFYPDGRAWDTRDAVVVEAVSNQENVT